MAVVRWGLCQVASLGCHAIAAMQQVLGGAAGKGRLNGRRLDGHRKAQIHTKFRRDCQIPKKESGGSL